MKSDQEIMRCVREAINECTRGLEEASSLRYQIAQKTKGEEPVRKKASTSMILVIALIVISMTTALAAGLGLFGEMAGTPHADDRLAALEAASGAIGATLTTADGVTIEIGQAYYEGDRVFMSYKLSGAVAGAELHEGAPEGACAWDEVMARFIPAKEWTDDHPALQRANEWLDGSGQRWAATTVAFLEDGLYLADGTYLTIIGGDELIAADGSLIGWKECVLPQDKLADTVTFKAVLSRSGQVIFQDGDTCMRKLERGETTDMCFTLSRNDRYVYLKGDAATDQYQAQAALASGQVDMKGTIRLTVPEAWASALSAPETDETADVIVAWSLYQHGALVSKTGTTSLMPDGPQRFVYELLYPRMADLDGLTLVPEHARTGEHPDEAIAIRPILE